MRTQPDIDLPPPLIMPSGRLESALMRDDLTAVVQALQENPWAATMRLSRIELPLHLASRYACSPKVLIELGKRGAVADATMLKAVASEPVHSSRRDPHNPFLFLPPSEEDRQRDEERRILTARCLLRAGADPELADAKGKRPSYHAKAAGRFQLAALFVDVINSKNGLERAFEKRASLLKDGIVRPSSAGILELAKDLFTKCLSFTQYHEEDPEVPKENAQENDFSILSRQAFAMDANVAERTAFPFQADAAFENPFGRFDFARALHILQNGAPANAV